MKIEKITVGSYGKLSEKEITFSDGINVVYGKNESGKSTLSSFIRYILYGFSGSKTREVSTNDRLKYMPWDGGAVSGSAVISAKGEQFRIERRNGAKSSLKVTKNGAECLFGKEPGEEILGVDEASFSRMAFISQTDICPDSMDKVSDSVQNIVFAADETVNVARARSRLTEFRNHFRTTRKTGRCYELEEKIRQLRYSFDESSELHKTLLAAEAKLAETRIKIRSNNEKAALLENELRSIDGFEAKLLLDKIASAKAELEHSAELLSAARAELEYGNTVCTEQVIDSIIEAYRKHTDLEKQLSYAKDRLSKAKQRKLDEQSRSGPVISREEFSALEKRINSLRRAKLIFTVLGIAFALFGAAFVAVGLFTVMGSVAFIPSAVLFVLALIFVIMAAANSGKVSSAISEGGFSGKKEYEDFSHSHPFENDRLSELSAQIRLLENEVSEKENEYAAAEKELCDLLLPFGAELSGAGELIVEIKTKLDKVKEAVSEYNKREAMYKAYLESHDVAKLVETAEHYDGTAVRDRKIVMREYEFFKKANENLSELEKQYIKQAASPASGIRKPSEILAERQATEAVLKECIGKADAAELALSAIDMACEDLKMGVSPAIAGRAGELFSIFTGQKYGGLELSSDFGPGLEYGGIIRESGFFSTGTRDAAYLALRIALCEVLFREKPVLVFDEVFAYFDDARLKNAIAVLEKLSENYQIILFTCHEREIKVLSEHSNSFSLINM